MTQAFYAHMNNKTIKKKERKKTKKNKSTSVSQVGLS
jgi:hypothetical protein